MRTIFPTLTLLFAFLCPSAGFSVDDKKIATEIDREVEKIRMEMVKIRRLIHMDPQLPGREQETAKIVASRLSALGLEVKTNIAGSGVTGLLRGAQPGPVIGLRAEMDAMPIQEMADVPFKSVNGGVMHAHGHDLHVAIALGTAYVLNGLRNQMKGAVIFIFQPGTDPADPARESGASRMIKEGVLDSPPVNIILGFHVWPEALGQVYSASGPILAASDSFEIDIKGRPAQASQPQEGVDAIVLAAQVINALQTIVSRSVEPTDPASLTIGRIAGGTKADLVSDRVWMDGILRTMNDATRRKVQRLMEAAVKGTTQAFGGDYSLTFRQSVPAVSNHPELFASLLPALNAASGDRTVQTLGPQMMSDDFSFYGRKIPGLFFFLGTKNSRTAPAPLDSPYFNPDERSIPIGIKILSHVILDCLEQQSRLTDSAGIKLDK
ncbi:MAG: amidohydrolase [Candidatus Aminicenantes bacterium]|nr:amidohydrolase [Candidatus Aminicenantes bacterium]